MGEIVAPLPRRFLRRSPDGLPVAGFAALIVAGAAVLALPISQRGGVSLLDALFTATSAVCVTGLTVVDTGHDFTIFGQLVILLLIQFGGIGVMSLAAMAMRIARRRLSLAAQAALSSSMLQRDVAGELASIVWRILGFVLTAEALGAVILFVAMVPTRSVAHAAYSAVFHSISAFCNAGFSIYSENLTVWRESRLVMVTVMSLIFIGGIGHHVAMDVGRALARLITRKGSGARRPELGSVVALFTSAALIVGGALLLLLFGLTPEEPEWETRVWNALFQSVTARTAGFNTVRIGLLPPGSLLVLSLLMFVGGSPGSCAGGIKTTTFALWVAKLWSFLRGAKGTRILGRYIPSETTRRASLLVGLSVLWNTVGLLFLLATQGRGIEMHDVLVEQLSAFGTVGLSTGLTPGLTAAGKLWIMATMFVGRLGPLTLALWALGTRGREIRYPEGRIMVG